MFHDTLLTEEFYMTKLDYLPSKITQELVGKLRILPTNGGRGGVKPKSSVVIFKDKNRANFALENLQCVSRSVFLRMNQRHWKDQPKELLDSVIMLSKLVLLCHIRM